MWGLYPGQWFYSLDHETFIFFTGLHIYFNLPLPKIIRITWDQIRDQSCWAGGLIPDYSPVLKSSHIYMVQVITQKTREASFKKVGSQLSSRGPLLCQNVSTVCTDLMTVERKSETNILIFFVPNFLTLAYSLTLRAALLSAHPKYGESRLQGVQCFLSLPN